MRPNERCPACRVPALRRRRQSVASQDIADRLIADTMPEISQRSGDPVITPISVLPGNANDQLLNRSADPRPAKASTGRRAIELAGPKLAVPGQDGVRPRHKGPLREKLAPQPMTELAQFGSLSVRELQPPLQLGLQNAIFGGQIFEACQQLLIHQPGDEGRDARPIHWSSTPADSRFDDRRES